MNRREWLTKAIIGAAALAIDPEELLWKPTKTIFIPPTRAICAEQWYFSWAEQINGQWFIHYNKNEQNGGRRLIDSGNWAKNYSADLRVLTLTDNS